ncbi:PHB depolymerase family esterase [Tateyamaria armeniaca]|uniref:PHB depolymerase family esterase n=1 Tax=Tateyamaria armeniaca TaxID=2518930 RepID=A0ABW8URN1_9RHOB
MKQLIFLLALIWAFPAFAMGPWQRDCQLDVPCELGERSYHVKEPDGWDGTSPLPVLIHFHGWQRTGALPVQHQRISGSTRRRGVLLIAPNGLRKTWNMWSPETEDVQFAADVLVDVAKRYPIDTDNIFLSGYSYGSIMAWRVACDRGAQMNVRALLGISGTLTRTDHCAEAPKEVRHVHGLKDNVLDFPFGPGRDTNFPVKLWREALECGDQSSDPIDWSAVDFLTLTRTTWTDCANGTTVSPRHPSWRTFHPARLDRAAVG